jgi:hypothetical protein
MQLIKQAAISALIGLTLQAQAWATEPGMTGKPGPASGWIERATLTTAVVEREPVDSIANLTTEHTQVYYFTEVRDMTGETVIHRWEYNGEIMAEIDFAVGGPRWRVYSSKTLLPGWTGDWKVSVLDAAGNALSVNSFAYTEVATATEQPVSAPRSQ